MSEPTPNAPENPAPEAPKAAVATAPKPAAAAAKPAAKDGETRRFFLFRWVSDPMIVAWSTFVASMGAMTLGTLRFLIPNVLSEPPSKFKAGLPDNYEEGKVTDNYKEKNTWIVRNGGIIYALSTTCTHLGCTPNWLEREGKFKCPCHGSGFYISGINFEGPAPRPLERWAVRIGDDGQIVVDKSKKFQQERGEWSNPESFIKV